MELEQKLEGEVGRILISLDKWLTFLIGMERSMSDARKNEKRFHKEIKVKAHSTEKLKTQLFYKFKMNTRQRYYSSR